MTLTSAHGAEIRERALYGRNAQFRTEQFCYQFQTSLSETKHYRRSDWRCNEQTYKILHVDEPLFDFLF